VSYSPVGHRKPRGLGIYKTVFIEGLTLTGTYTDHVEVEVSNAYLAALKFAHVQELLSGFVAYADTFSGRAMRVHFWVVKDPATTSGAQSALTALASGTSISGVKINALCFGE